MRNEDLKERTRKFALEIIRLVENLPKNRIADVLGRQILRSGTSIGANYRAACRARSRADFISKMGIVEEEADETLYWLELLLDARLVEQNQIQRLMNEANEIIAIVVTSIKTARRNRKDGECRIRNGEYRK
ncbi:MAG: four helix bundle protein [Nitrospinae bacterium RIFCSPLOWO2_12_FULL_45_22]|nr:MAG: four helix bundle protein [Nitrospinae bacterium RIFCSPLOWO2_12_FULL_45_22]